MGVIVPKRKESRLEVLIQANTLHDMLLELMQRNFGVKSIDRLVRRKYLFSKEQCEQRAYFRMVMNQSKIRIDHLCRLLIENIRAANTIYPISNAEFESRRAYQNDALVNCEQIKSELQRVVDIFDVDINLYARYIEALNREIRLIKSWRQKKNK